MYVTNTYMYASINYVHSKPIKVTYVAAMYLCAIHTYVMLQAITICMFIFTVILNRCSNNKFQTYNLNWNCNADENVYNTKYGS